MVGANHISHSDDAHTAVPAQYDAYLTQKYGDWRGGIPPDQQYGHHRYVICDLHRPFTEYTDTGEKGVKKS